MEIYTVNGLTDLIARLCRSTSEVLQENDPVTLVRSMKEIVLHCDETQEDSYTLAAKAVTLLQMLLLKGKELDPDILKEAREVVDAYSAGFQEGNNAIERKNYDFPADDVCNKAYALGLITCEELLQEQDKSEMELATD